MQVDSQATVSTHLLLTMLTHAMITLIVPHALLLLNAYGTQQQASATLMHACHTMIRQHATQVRAASGLSHHQNVLMIAALFLEAKPHVILMFNANGTR